MSLIRCLAMTHEKNNPHSFGIKPERNVLEAMALDLCPTEDYYELLDCLDTTSDAELMTIAGLS